ncbi:hypothetical protein FRB95_013728 [Tulasnella sp. JGI-2019a]|nr:hypothetical protein FRB95_013728 [Tulasnella sp. JGI-2019a]
MADKDDPVNYLSYTAGAILSQIIDQHDHIIANSSHLVEWMLVQTSTGFAPQTFQLRVTAGNNFQPTNIILVGWVEKKIYPVSGTSGANFTFKGVAPLETGLQK